MGNIFAEAKALVNRSFIEKEFGHPKGFWEGSNYKTVSPLRADANAGSFAIREDGVFFDYTNGDTGDIITLLSLRDGKTPEEVAHALLGITPGQDEKPRIKLSWIPIPKDRYPSLGRRPDYLTLYHDAEKGLPAFFIVRYNATATEKKVIYPLHWTGSVFEKGLPDDIKKNRPLLQFDPLKTVIMVEGEGKCEDARAAFPQYSWTCWHGGSSNVKNVNLSVLKDLDVIIWPDNDEPGFAAADFLSMYLPNICKRVRRVTPPMGKPKNWDVADAIKEKFDILTLIEDAAIVERVDIQDECNTITDPRPAQPRPLTDLGNSERFIDMWGHVIRYNVDKNKWLIWYGGYWADRDQTMIMLMLKRTIRTLALQDERKEAFFWAVKSEAQKSINAVLNLAQRERGVPVHEDELDQNPFYLNCPNGVVDLRNGELLDPNPNWLMTKRCKVNFNPQAQCPKFLSFLDETFQEDPGLMNFIQRWIGYSLTADTTAQTFAVFYGVGANGKSTLVETIQRIAGDYVKTAPPDTFIQKQSGGIPNDVAALRGSRMVLTTETEANAKLAEAKVKGMTGGDRVSARYMRGEFFEFNPTWKITISTNHRPRISGGDYGIWRRVVLVPFNNIVTPDKQDPLLPNKLLEEAEGILAWAVKGAMLWYSSGGGRLGLQVPQRVHEETQEYREDEDVIGRFLAQACYTSAEITKRVNNKMIPRDGAFVQDVFYSFRAWCSGEGEENYARTTQNMFTRYMRERGYIPERVSSGRYYPGVVPRDEFYRTSDREYQNDRRED
jgi:putative DNA primase/helicase